MLWTIPYTVTTANSAHCLILWTTMNNICILPVTSLNFFHLLAHKSNFEKNYIYSNKFFHNFHLSESNFTCPRLQASGLAWILCNKVEQWIKNNEKQKSMIYKKDLINKCPIMTERFSIQYKSLDSIEVLQATYA
jgi:hypothetical protein